MERIYWYECVDASGEIKTTFDCQSYAAAEKYATEHGLTVREAGETPNPAPRGGEMREKMAAKTSLESVLDSLKIGYGLPSGASISPKGCALLHDELSRLRARVAELEAVIGRALDTLDVHEKPSPLVEALNAALAAGSPAPKAGKE